MPEVFGLPLPSRFEGAKAHNPLKARSMYGLHHGEELERASSLNNRN